MNLIYSRYAKRRFNPDRPAITTFILFMSVVCWVGSYHFSLGFPMVEETEASLLWNFICRNMTQKWLTFGIGLLLMAGGGFLLHRANYTLVLIKEKTWLPFLIYVFLISSNLIFMPFRASSIAVFCLILSIYMLFTSYRDETSVKKAFNSALALALGSLIWSHILWFLPLFWVSMYSIRAFNFKTFCASLLGLATIYWLVLGWCVWKTDFSIFVQLYQSITNIQLIELEQYEWIGDLLPVFLITLLTVIASLNIWFNNFTDSLRTRELLNILIWIAIGSVVLILFYNQSAEESLQIACVPSSILIGHFFAVRRTRLSYWSFVLTILLLSAYILFRLWSFL